MLSLQASGVFSTTQPVDGSPPPASAVAGSAGTTFEG
jgi:hypothetical protein